MSALWKAILSGGNEMPLGMPPFEKLQSHLLPPLWI